MHMKAISLKLLLWQRKVIPLGLFDVVISLISHLLVLLPIQNVINCDCFLFQNSLIYISYINDRLSAKVTSYVWYVFF